MTRLLTWLQDYPLVFVAAVLMPFVAVAVARSKGYPAWELVALGAVLVALFAALVIYAASREREEEGQVTSRGRRAA